MPFKYAKGFVLIFLIQSLFLFGFSSFLLGALEIVTHLKDMGQILAIMALANLTVTAYYTYEYHTRK